MTGVLLLMMVLASPIFLILWSAIERVGLTWSLLLIPAGAMIGAVVMAIVSTCLYEFSIWLNDRKTGPPPAGAIGAGVGRGIMGLIFMALFGWVGSGLGACWASHWIR